MKDKENIQELGSSKLKNRQKYMIVTFWFFKRCYIEHGMDMFSVMLDEWTKSNGYKL